MRFRLLKRIFIFRLHSSCGILSLLICLSFIGCYNSYYLAIPREEKSIPLFDKYYIEIECGVIDGKIVGADILTSYMVDVITDTPDTLSILILDSCCFKTSCMSSVECRTLISGYELQMSNWRMGKEGSLYPGKPKYEDLVYIKSTGRVRPNSYSITDDSTLNVPVDCDSLEMILYSRLLDRSSGKEIDKNIKTIKLKYKHFKTWGPGNM